MGRKCYGMKRSKTVRIFRLKAYPTKNESQIEIPSSQVMELYTAEDFKIGHAKSSCAKSISKNRKSNIESNSNVYSNYLNVLDTGDKLFEETVSIPNYIKVLEDGDRKFETSVAFSSLGLALAWVTILLILIIISLRSESS